MFQAVFIWAQPLIDVISAAFALLGREAEHVLAPGLLQSFGKNGAARFQGSAAF